MPVRVRRWSGEWPRRDNPCPRSRATAVRRCPTFKVRSSVKRYHKSKVKETPTKMVGAERGHQTVDRLKPLLQKNSQSNHMDHSLV